MSPGPSGDSEKNENDAVARTTSEGDPVKYPSM